MGLLKRLPTFKIVEMNRSTGLVTGYVLSQYKVDLEDTAVKNVYGVDFVEQGTIVGLNGDLTISNYDKTEHSVPFIVFTEELNTLIDGLKYFANEEDAEGNIYLRAVALLVGDTWTTDNYSGTLDETTLFAKVVGGVATLQKTADADTLFAVEKSTTPLGEMAVRLTYLGVKPTAVE